MLRLHNPRKGSLQFWPRKRAKKHVARVKSWSKEDGVLGFLGYKVGMTHVQYFDKNPKIKYKDQKSTSVTIIDCPPLKPFSLRFYSGSKIISEIMAKNLDKELKRKINMPKKSKDQIPEKYDKLALLVYTQPKLARIKKKPDIFEMKINLPLEEAKKLLEKEIKISEVF